jgi:hypothetical protein
MKRYQVRFVGTYSVSSGGKKGLAAMLKGRIANINLAVSKDEVFGVEKTLSVKELAF